MNGCFGDVGRDAAKQMSRDQSDAALAKVKNPRFGVSRIAVVAASYRECGFKRV